MSLLKGSNSSCAMPFIFACLLNQDFSQPTVVFDDFAHAFGKVIVGFVIFVETRHKLVVRE